MVRALLVPAVALFILKFSPELANWISSDPGFYGRALIGWFSFLITTALYALFAITCHRLALIGNPGVPDHGLLTWTKREWQYLGWAFIIMIVWMLYSFVINSFYISIIIEDVEAGASVESFQSTKDWLNLLYIPLAYFFCRLSVLYPAIAVDQPVTAQWAWRLTAHNGWRMALVVGLLPFVLYFLLNLLLRENATFVEILFLSIIEFFVFAVQFVALSFSYKHLTEIES